MKFECKMVPTSFFRKTMNALPVGSVTRIQNFTIKRLSSTAYTIVGEGGVMSAYELADVLYDCQPCVD